MVDVEVANHDVAVVEVVMVDVELIIARVAAIAGSAKNCEMSMT